MIEDDPRIASLATIVFEQRLQIRDLVAGQLQMGAEIARLSGRKPAHRVPPVGWLNLKRAADIANVAVETVRLWCVRGNVVAELFDGQWWVHPPSLGLWNSSRK